MQGRPLMIIKEKLRADQPIIGTEDAGRIWAHHRKGESQRFTGAERVLLRVLCCDKRGGEGKWLLRGYDQACE